MMQSACRHRPFPLVVEDASRSFYSTGGGSGSGLVFGHNVAEVSVVVKNGYLLCFEILPIAC